jgi:hypothetical protein
MKRRILQLAALVLLVGLGAGLTVALLQDPSGSSVDAGPARAQLSPQDAQFGDTVVARLDVPAGSSLTDKVDFGPYAIVSKAVESHGGRIVTSYRLRCLEQACVPRGKAKLFRFKPAVWPVLHVSPRITKADAAAPVLRVPPPTPARATYRVPPTATGVVLLVLAGLLAAAGAFLLLRVGLRRTVPTRRSVPPLERALAELAASSANGDSGRRRRALEDLARELEPLDAPLSAESRVLAWGPEEPQAEAVTDLASRVRREVQR